MRLKVVLLIIVSCTTGAMQAQAQDSLWTLPECVHYAITHNLDLNQSVLNRRMAKLQLNQNRLSQIPTLSAGASYGKSYGRSIDPTSNQFIKGNYSFVGLNSNLDVLLFGWFSKRNSIAADKLTLQSTESDYEQLKDDISLNVATGFLRILLAKEQVAISKEQVRFSVEQMEQTKAFVDVGRSPELDLVQMQAQVATDSAAYFTALNDYQHSILQLKAIMNLDMGNNLKIVAPEIDDISLKVLNQNAPQQIFEVAKQNFGTIKSNQLKVAAAQKELASRKGALYPQLAFGLQLGSNYSSTQKDITNPHISGSEPTGEYIDINGNQYLVMQPKVEYGFSTTPFSEQLNNNFRQTAVLSLSVPIFNGWTARTSVKQAKIDIENRKIEEEKAEVQLKQDIFSAYYDAKAAAEKYYSAKKAAKASTIALDYAKKRYNLGLVSALDLLTTQNNTFKSESDAASAKYDLMFKLKVLDYYLGRPLKID